MTTAPGRRGGSTQERPRPGAVRPYQFPRSERLALPNGLQVIVVPVRRLPVIAVNFVTDAGAMMESPGDEGLAQLTARGLLEGSGERRGDEMMELFERLGASIDSGASWDSAIVKVSGLAPRLDTMLELLGEVVLTPTFPEHEVERLKSERLAELLQLRAEPRQLADEMLAVAVYARDSRYAHPQDGSAESVTALSADSLRRFHAERYRPAGSAIVIAGDVPPEHAFTTAAHVFGAWKAVSPSAVTVVDRPARRARAMHLVKKTNAQQSEMRLGHVAVPRASANFFPVLVMNAVLGGLFSSRINLNLREAHGYTYGASSYFDWRRAAGPFVVSAAVRSDVTGDAAREVLSEIDRIRTEPITENELSLATSYLDGVFPVKYETVGAVANALTAAIVFALPDDYFDRYRANVRAVTVDDVLMSAQSYLHPDQLQLLVVGDPAIIRSPLERMEFGPLISHDRTDILRGS